jgi:hypothetical protein
MPVVENLSRSIMVRTSAIYGTDFKKANDSVRRYVFYRFSLTLEYTGN